MIFVGLLCFRGVFVVIVVGGLLGVVWCGVGSDCKCGVVWAHLLLPVSWPVGGGPGA